MDLAQRIQILEDREQIRELGATYCFLVDGGHYEKLVHDYFTRDAECDFRIRLGNPDPMISKGRQQVLGFFREIVASTLKDMSHTVHNHRIAIEGDQASGDCYFELTARDANTSMPMIGAGRYQDLYQRVEDRWRFSQRNADILYIVPLNEGW